MATLKDHAEITEHWVRKLSTDMLMRKVTITITSEDDDINISESLEYQHAPAGFKRIINELDNGIEFWKKVMSERWADRVIKNKKYELEKNKQKYLDTEFLK